MNLLPLAIGFVTFCVAVLVLDRRRVAQTHRRVSSFVEPRTVTVPTDAGEAVLDNRLQRPLVAVEARLRRVPGWTSVDRLRERAALPLRTVELVCAVVFVLLLFALLGLAAGWSPAAVLVLELLVVVALRGWFALRISRRRRAFEDQLPELLQSVASALRAGHGLNQALAAVAADSPEPIRGEFARVLAEARLGRPLEDALADLGARVASKDLEFVLDAVIVQRQVGGSLAGIFEIVAETVRQRQQFMLKVRALTAMGRMSGLVLIALPFALALLLTLLNRDYLTPLFDTGLGRALVAVALTLMAVGTLWLRSIISMKGVTQ